MSDMRNMMITIQFSYRDFDDYYGLKVQIYQDPFYLPYILRFFTRHFTRFTEPPTRYDVSLGEYHYPRAGIVSVTSCPVSDFCKPCPDIEISMLRTSLNRYFFRLYEHTEILTASYDLGL